MTESLKRSFMPAAVIRRLLTSWICSAAFEYLLLSPKLRALETLDGLAAMSLIRVILVTVGIYIVLHGISLFYDNKYIERGLMTAGFVALAAMALSASFTIPFLVVCLLILGAFVIFIIFGGNTTSAPQAPLYKERRRYKIITAAIAAALFLFISIWTVFRVISFSTPTYDFGIFAQMFENMRKTGIPVTTVERATAMSHFNVHVSPIYYLLLPIYMIVPRPETLQVLQAAVLASAAIPMWKIAKHHGLSPLLRTLVCAMLMLYPAVAGGASYDIHENCFLTPLILWMLYGMDKLSIPITSVAAILTLMVKEDSAVYVAVAALWLIVKTLIGSDKKKKGLIIGAAVLVASIIYFLCTTTYLANVGDGVMTGRYQNFMYDDSGSLITVIKSVILCPMKAIFECVDFDKLLFIVQSLIPLLCLPLITRRYDRYILLIPYILINLMSDYPYQHYVYFQYVFGSLAFLLYLTCVNLSDLKPELAKLITASSATLSSVICFAILLCPRFDFQFFYTLNHLDHFKTVSESLDKVPEGASVATSGFFTTHYADHEKLYDLYYSTNENIFSCEYIVIDPGLEPDHKFKYIYGSDVGFDAFLKILKHEGYELYHKCESGSVAIFKKGN